MFLANSLKAGLIDTITIFVSDVLLIRLTGIGKMVAGIAGSAPRVDVVAAGDLGESKTVADKLELGGWTIAIVS